MTTDKKYEMNHLLGKVYLNMSQLFKKLGSSNILNSQFEYTRSKDYDFSSLQSDEEIKEITLQLVMIRKAYDSIVHENSQKRTQIDVMKKQIFKLQNTTATCNDDQTSISIRMNNLQNQLDMLRYKLEEEQQANKTYEHMLARMKTETIDLEVRSSFLHDNLSTVKGHLDDYLQKSRKNKEENVQSQKILKVLKEDLRLESKNQEDLVRRLESTARAKKEAANRRTQRVKKQAEIAEIAANENRNAEEIALKQEISLHKLYFMFLKYKHDKKCKEFEGVEEAFKNIRVATGISNIQTIIDGFLRKEDVAASLKNNISDSEKQLNLLKKKNEKARNELNILYLSSKENSSPYFSKIAKIHAEIDHEKKNLENSQEEKEFFSNLLRLVSEMGERIQNMLNVPQKPSILENFQEIAKTVLENCEDIQRFRSKYFKELENKDHKEMISLYRSLHPSKISKPKYLHDTSFKEDEEFITVDEE